MPGGATIGEQLIRSTVRIVAFKNGHQISTGTGFFYKCKRNDIFADVCITNKHVIEGADHIQLTVAFAADHEDLTKGSNGQIGTVTVRLNGSQIEHPTSDLAAFSVGQAWEKLISTGQHPLIVHLTSDIIPKTWDQFDAIEELLMIGCPNGLFDEVNNVAVVRKGITATPIPLPYKGVSEFLVDMACFPGSSGSPVFIYNQSGYQDMSSRNFVIGSGRVLLVGVLYSGPTISQSGEIVLARKPSFNINTMMHLGIVIRASEVLTLETMIWDCVDKQT